MAVSSESDVLDIIGALEDVDEEEEGIRSFGGLTTMVLKVRAKRWQGRVMRAFMLALPSICNKSAVNRGIARDEGALDHIVEFLLKVSKEIQPGDDEDAPDIDADAPVPPTPAEESQDARESAGEELGDGAERD